MSKKKRTPSERRRLKRRRPASAPKPEFDRPVEWIQQEIVGVQTWIERLEGKTGESFPEPWRKGQLRHYTNRLKELNDELERAQAAAADDEA